MLVFLLLEQHDNDDGGVAAVVFTPLPIPDLLSIM